MMPSRGMGVISPPKRPKAKVINRKDDPNRVRIFAKGGTPKQPATRKQCK